MAAICVKEFALHVGPAVSLVDYWDFDDGGTPFIAKLDPDNNFAAGSGAVGSAAGILNTCMRISAVPLAGTASVLSIANPLINPTHGFTWTTWINFASFGGGAIDSVIFEIHFLNASNVEVINFQAIMIGIGFVVMLKNGANFFSPSASFGTALWNFIQIQYDPATKKFGFQRGHPIFGLSGFYFSGAIADDLSSITKGYLVLKTVNNGVSSDYRQDESGFWARLLTNAEVIQLFGGGTPPAYPAIPQ